MPNLRIPKVVDYMFCAFYPDGTLILADPETGDAEMQIPVQVVYIKLGKFVMHVSNFQGWGPAMIEVFPKEGTATLTLVA